MEPKGQGFKLIIFAQIAMLDTTMFTITKVPGFMKTGHLEINGISINLGITGLVSIIKKLVEGCRLAMPMAVSSITMFFIQTMLLVFMPMMATK